jgi:hypothetical protein
MRPLHKLNSRPLKTHPKQTKTTHFYYAKSMGKIDEKFNVHEK